MNAVEQPGQTMRVLRLTMSASEALLITDRKVCSRKPCIACKRAYFANKLLASTEQFLNPPLVEQIPSYWGPVTGKKPIHVPDTTAIHCANQKKLGRQRFSFS
jgi:hypothetical protein